MDKGRTIPCRPPQGQLATQTRERPASSLSPLRAELWAWRPAWTRLLGIRAAPKGLPCSASSNALPRHDRPKACLIIGVRHRGATGLERHSSPRLRAGPPRHWTQRRAVVWTGRRNAAGLGIMRPLQTKHAAPFPAPGASASSTEQAPLGPCQGRKLLARSPEGPKAMPRGVVLREPCRLLWARRERGDLARRPAQRCSTRQESGACDVRLLLSGDQDPAKVRRKPGRDCGLRASWRYPHHPWHGRKTSPHHRARAPQRRVNEKTRYTNVHEHEYYHETTN